jgi:hypothetical protein
MIHVACGLLEGILVCLCRASLGVIYSMEDCAILTFTGS